MLAAYKVVCLIAGRRRAQLQGKSVSEAELRDLRSDDAVDQGAFAEFLWRSQGIRPAAGRALFAALDVDDEAEEGEEEASVVTAAEFLILPQFLQLSPPGMYARPWDPCCRPSPLNEFEFVPEQSAIPTGANASGPVLQAPLLNAQTSRNRWCAGALCGSHFARRYVRHTVREILYTGVCQIIIVAAVLANATLAASWSVGAAWDYQKCLGVTPNEADAARCSAHPVISSIYAWPILLSLVQSVELGMRMLSTGSATRWLAASGWNLLDFFVILWSLVSDITLAGGREFSLPPAVHDIFALSRGARILRVMSVLPPIRAFVNAVAGTRKSSVLRLSLMYMVLYVCITYMFALLGVEIFGNVPPTGISDDDQVYRMDTLQFAFLQLFQIATSNNWNSLVYNLDYGVGNRYDAVYFVVYFFSVTMVLSSIVEGMIIEAYEQSREDLHRDRLQRSIFASAGGERGDSDQDSDTDGEDEADEEWEAEAARKRKTRPKDPIGVSALPPLLGDGTALHCRRLARCVGVVFACPGPRQWALRHDRLGHRMRSDSTASLSHVHESDVRNRGTESWGLASADLRNYVAEQREQLRDDIDSQTPKLDDIALANMALKDPRRAEDAEERQRKEYALTAAQARLLRAELPEVFAEK